MVEQQLRVLSTHSKNIVLAALVDSDAGSMMARSSASNTNLEAAAAGNSEVIKAKRRVAEASKLSDEIEGILKYANQSGRDGAPRQLSMPQSTHCTEIAVGWFSVESLRTV